MVTLLARIQIPGGERWPGAPCPCGQRDAHQSGESDRREVENDRGVLIKVIHDDRKICEFVEYASISSFVERGEKKTLIFLECFSQA
jgi:hypothetical protein